MPHENRERMMKEMLSGGFGMSVASVILNPLDVIKVRIQLAPDSYDGMIDCGRRSIQRGGGFVRGLCLPGLSATVLRDLLNGSFRVGLYKEIERNLFPVGSEVPLLVRKMVTGIVVGSTAGVWSHTDLIKTRMQSIGGYSSLYNAYADIVRLDGVRGLYRGLVPNLVRASLITTSHVGSYDFAKSALFCRDDTVLSWVLCGFFSALVTTTVSAPVDLIRTRIMVTTAHNSPHMTDIIRSIYRTEGFRGFFRGWLPSFYRFGPHFTISWPLIELARTRIFGMDSF